MNTPAELDDRCRATVAWIVADGAERRRAVVERKRAAKQERLAALRAVKEKRCADLADRRRVDAAKRAAVNRERTEEARDRLNNVRTAELYRRVARIEAHKARDARTAPATGRRQRDADVARYWAKVDGQRQHIADTKTLTMRYVLKTWPPARPKSVAVQAAPIVPEMPRAPSEHCAYVQVITTSSTTTARPVASELVIRNKWPLEIWPRRFCGPGVRGDPFGHCDGACTRRWPRGRWLITYPGSLKALEHRARTTLKSR